MTVLVDVQPIPINGGKTLTGRLEESMPILHFAIVGLMDGSQHR